MEQQIHKLYLLLFLILFGCKNEEKQVLQKEDQISSIAVTKKQDSLLIEGDNIWVRDNPTKGKVVMKLNEGDRCVIIDTGKTDSIKGHIDYWYQIKYRDTTGWVFGSQTNIKSARSEETKLFLEQIQLLITALGKQNFTTLNSFIDPEKPLFCVLESYRANMKHKIATDFEELLAYDKSTSSHSNMEGLFKCLSAYDTVNISYKTMANPDEYPLLQENWSTSQEEEAVGSNRVQLFYSDIRDENRYVLSSFLQDYFSQNGINNEQQKEIEHLREIEKQNVFELVIMTSNMGTYTDVPVFYFYMKDKKWYLSELYFVDAGA